MKIRAVDFTMYRVSDLAKSVDFYTNILGLKPNGQGEGWAEFLAGDDAIVLGAFGFEKGTRCGNASVGLAVDDAKKAIEELKKKGVNVKGDIWETPVCKGFTVLDPDGNEVSFHQRNDGTAG